MAKFAASSARRWTRARFIKRSAPSKASACAPSSRPRKPKFWTDWRAGEFRDDDTGQHTRRVGDQAAQLAARLGFAPERVEIMRRAAPLHDIGKIGVPDSILLKPGKLTGDEFAVIRTHCEIGARLLHDGKSELVQMAQKIARSHHERFDGDGYPDKLIGEQIPIEGRIVAVVDVFDALTSQRPYKEAWPVERALTEIAKCAGTQFDPSVVTAFIAMFE